MKGKRFLIGLVLLLIPLLAISCAAGVSQEEHDKVKSDLAAAQAQVGSLQSDVEADKSQLETVRSLYDEARRFALVVAQQEAGSISDEYTMAKNVTIGLTKSAAGCPLCSGACGMDDCDCFVYEPLPPME